MKFSPCQTHGAKEKEKRIRERKKERNRDWSPFARETARESGTARRRGYSVAVAQETARLFLPRPSEITVRRWIGRFPRERTAVNIVNWEML